MESQVALQFLATVLQVAATFMALYMAIIIFILQNRILRSYFLRNRVVWIAFGGCLSLWLLTIVICLQGFLGFNSQLEFPQSEAMRITFSLLSALAISILTFVLILWDTRKWLVQAKDSGSS